jgi:hypothetical protein
MMALLCVALLSINIALIALWRFNTPQAVGVLVAVVPLPLVFGMFGFGTGGDSLYASIQVITLAGVYPASDDLAEGGAIALAAVLIGLTLSLPAYLVAVIGLVYRACIGGSR